MMGEAATMMKRIYEMLDSVDASHSPAIKIVLGQLVIEFPDALVEIATEKALDDADCEKLIMTVFAVQQQGTRNHVFRPIAERLVADGKLPDRVLGYVQWLLRARWC